MPVNAASIGAGRCYARLSEIRKVVRIENGEVIFHYRSCTDGPGGIAKSLTPQRLPLERFAAEADAAVSCPADL